jgi:hypothetical protein
MSGLSGLSMMRNIARVSVPAKSYSTKLPRPLGLTSTSPFIRPLAGPSDATDHEAIQRDFKFWPSFFTKEESSEILKMALWKLDRADTTRRRRKRKSDQNTVMATGLQGLFEGEYGFEEVSFSYPSVSLDIQLIRCRDTMTRSYMIIAKRCCPPYPHPHRRP